MLSSDICINKQLTKQWRAEELDSTMKLCNTKQKLERRRSSIYICLKNNRRSVGVARSLPPNVFMEGGLFFVSVCCVRERFWGGFGLWKGRRRGSTLAGVAPLAISQFRRPNRIEKAENVESGQLIVTIAL